jgi:ribonuclease HI
MADNSYFTVIHTDGGSRPNPGQGAYAAILQHQGKSAVVRGYVPYATNNQMELAAVIAALHALKSTRIPVKLYVDSQYVHDGATRWLKGWRKNNWKTSNGDPVKNVELWQELDEIMGRYVISWHKVTSHAGSAMNNRADELVWDTRDAAGDPAKYQVTNIPTIESPWEFTVFQNRIVNAKLPPQAKAMGNRFRQILTNKGK